MQKSLHFTHNARFKEILMEIAVKCSENTIGNFVNNIDDMRILFDSLSPAVLQFFENGFLSTQHTDKVRNADWLIKENSVVFENNSSILNELKANKIIKKERKKKGKKGKVQNRQVELKMLCLDWLFNTNNQGEPQDRGDLVVALSKAPHEYYFSTDLVITLVDSFWVDYRSAMIWYAFFPFVGYFFSVQCYFVWNLQHPVPQDARWTHDGVEIYTRLQFVFFWTVFLIFELI